MKPEKTLLLAVAFAAFAAGSSAAQVAVEPEAALRAALDDARAAVAASPAKPIPSCADAKELETSFQLAVSFRSGLAPAELNFEYAGCAEEGRNDYLPPYTTRSYKGADGYGLTVVTNDGESSSEVLVSKGKDWVAQFGSLSNARLASGDPVSAGVMTVKDASSERRGIASVRNAAKPMYPQLNRCEASDWSKASGSGAPTRSGGKPDMGFGRGGPSLVLLTKTAAFYYHEDCDICAEITKCELGSGALSSVAVAHSVDCSDIKKYRSEPGVVFDACAEGQR